MAVLPGVRSPRRRLRAPSPPASLARRAPRRCPPRSPSARPLTVMAASAAPPRRRPPPRRVRAWCSSVTATGMASAWGSGDRWGTRSAETPAQGTSPMNRSSTTSTGARRSRPWVPRPRRPSINGGNVIVAMTENNGDDLIATAASGTVSVAGVTATAAARPLPSHRSRLALRRLRERGVCRPRGLATGRHRRHRADGGGHQRGPGRAVPARAQHRDARIAHRGGDHRRAGPDGQHPPARAVRGRCGAVGVALDVGHAGRCRARRERTGASSSPRPRPWPPGPMSRPTHWATAAMPTRVTRAASPTRA